MYLIILSLVSLRAGNGTGPESFAFGAVLIGLAFAIVSANISTKNMWWIILSYVCLFAISFMLSLIEVGYGWMAVLGTAVGLLYQILHAIFGSKKSP